MPENLFKTQLKERRVSLGIFLALGNSFAAEVIGSCALDWLCIDMQHGMFSFETTLGMIQSIASTKSSPIVRIPKLDSALIGKVLDAGAHGIVAPSIESSQDAKDLVEACKYPPLGSRSIGPSRAGMYWGEGYIKGETGSPAIIAMIETRKGVENSKEIASIPDIDAILLGPADLRASFGLCSQSSTDEEEYFSIVSRISKTCRDNDIGFGVFISDMSILPDYLEFAPSFYLLSTDIHLLRKAVLDAVSSFQELVAK